MTEQIHVHVALGRVDIVVQTRDVETHARLTERREVLRDRVRAAVTAVLEEEAL